MSVPFSRLAQELPARLGLDPAALKAKVREIAALARAQWVALAQEKLRSTRADYLRGLTAVRWQGRSAVIALVGVWPNVLEHGKPSWDLRETLLVAGKVRSVKRSKEGYLYLAVPFRHTGPGGPGARAMGRAYGELLGKESGRRLGRQLAARAKELEATRTAPLGGGTRWGGRLNTEDLQLPKLREHHVTDIYSGMVRQEKTYRKATQSQYTTWRMISDNPASIRSNVAGANSWTHPGIQAAGLLSQVRRFVAQEAPQLLVRTGGGA